MSKKSSVEIPKLQKKSITEEDGLQQEWYEDASHITRANLQEFINHIMDDYDHDYGTYCHALTAAAIATVHAYGTELSGFQASIISILFPRNYFYRDILTGISIRDWDDMLYPQYEQKFQKNISKDMWEGVKQAAQKNLDEKVQDEEFGGFVSPEVEAHWQSIVEGNVPFGYEVVE